MSNLLLTFGQKCDILQRNKVLAASFIDGERRMMHRSGVWVWIVCLVYDVDMDTHMVKCTLHLFFTFNSPDGSGEFFCSHF